MTERSLPEGAVSVRFHKDPPGYEPQHFERLMIIDKVTVAMYGCLYDDLTDEEEQDLVIAHCLGLPAKRDESKPMKRWHVRGVPRSQRRI